VAVAKVTRHRRIQSDAVLPREGHQCATYPANAAYG
jgi:hypothetical protein